MDFNVLDPDLNIFQNTFLEASAGTGKTFTIEQLIVRFLTEGQQPFSIQQILAVTFTRLATREMKNRVRTTLEKFLQKETLVAEKVRAALICFDEAQIFTLHSFCHQMLTEFAFEAEVGFELTNADALNYQELLRKTIKDYFSLGLFGKNSDEVEKLLKKYKWEGLLKVVAEKVQKKEEDSNVLGEIVKECRQLFTEASAKNEIGTPDTILEKMKAALKKPLFVEKVQKKYKAVIVDEFQDTDPVQFEIFKTLFFNSDCLIYFIGDPKQSIYGFRNADLYTYLSAAKLFPNTAHLDTNFRSTPKLVEALNLLFSSTPGWNLIPKTKQILTYYPVKVGKGDESEIQDGKGAVHFLLGKLSLGRARTFPTKEYEEKILFPAIANEICALNLPLSECVVLVKDRFQAARLQTFFSRNGIPSSVRKSLVETTSFQAMKDLLFLLDSPKSIKALKTVFFGPLIKSDRDQILEGFQKKMGLIQELYACDGFAVFIKEFIETFQIGDRHFIQLAEILIEEKRDLSSFLEKLETLNPEEEPRLQVRETDEHKIPIMTIFACKGLEFQIVFALALTSRHSGGEEGDFEEKDAEKMRQLYVALTRAKKRVYIPLLFEESKKKIGKGSASPIELFAALWSEEQGLPLSEKSCIDFLEAQGKQASLTYEWMQEKAVHYQQIQPSSSVLKPQQKFSFKDNFLVSFSSLAQKEQHESAAIILPDEASIHSIPVGARTGILVHSMMETIFEKNFQDIEQIIAKKLKSTELEDWETILSKQINALLNMPLDGFCLRDLKPTECLTEMEFLFPEQERSIKGFADLVFYKNDRYYLLDWKTNWLGSSDEAYSKEAMKKTMLDNDYYLQAEIYAAALKRYVKLFDTRPFEQIYGGAFYIFVRGKTFLKVL